MKRDPLLLLVSYVFVIALSAVVALRVQRSFDKRPQSSAPDVSTQHVESLGPMDAVKAQYNGASGIVLAGTIGSGRGDSEACNDYMVQEWAYCREAISAGHSVEAALSLLLRTCQDDYRWLFDRAGHALKDQDEALKECGAALRGRDAVLKKCSTQLRACTLSP